MSLIGDFGLRLFSNAGMVKTSVTFREKLYAFCMERQVSFWGAGEECYGIDQGYLPRPCVAPRRGFLR